MSKHDGISLIEVMVSIIALSTIMLAFAEYSSNTFKVSYDHSQILEKTNQNRFITERIISQVQKSDYIFPLDHSFTVKDGTNSNVYNTNDNIFMLVQDKSTDDATPEYFLISFYIDDKKDLYEFISNDSIEWTQNTLPYSNFATITGFSTKIASNVDPAESNLDYVINYNNGVTDNILKGGVSGAKNSDSNALISGIEWDLQIEQPSVEILKIKGLSNNVPRFIQ